MTRRLLPAVALALTAAILGALVHRIGLRPALAADVPASSQRTLLCRDTVVFQSDRGGNWEIYTLSSNGAGLARLTYHAAADVAPAWAP